MSTAYTLNTADWDTNEMRVSSGRFLLVLPGKEQLIWQSEM